MSNANLANALKTKFASLNHAQRIGLSAQWTNFISNEIRILEAELVRRFKNRRVGRLVRTAANRFKGRRSAKRSPNRSPNRKVARRN